MTRDELAISEKRYYKVIQHNDLIQKTRYSLKLQEQRTLAYLVSKIKPDAETLEKEYQFTIREFCKVCGVSDRGAMYEYVKKSIIDLYNAGFWLRTEEHKIESMRWLEHASIKDDTGVVTVKFSKTLEPYLIGLSKEFTAYELINILPMKSQYSIRIYELLKSHAYEHLDYEVKVDDLKEQLEAENYNRYPDFKRRVLDKAVSEINEFTDLEIRYEQKKEGRRVDSLVFKIRRKKDKEVFLTHTHAENKVLGVDEEIPGQMTILEYLDD